MDHKRAAELLSAIKTNVGKVIVGKDEIVAPEERQFITVWVRRGRSIENEGGASLDLIDF